MTIPIDIMMVKNLLYSMILRILQLKKVYTNIKYNNNILKIIQKMIKYKISIIVKKSIIEVSIKLLKEKFILKNLKFLQIILKLIKTLKILIKVLNQIKL